MSSSERPEDPGAPLAGAPSSEDQRAPAAQAAQRRQKDNRKPDGEDGPPSDSSTRQPPRQAPPRQKDNSKPDGDDDLRKRSSTQQPSRPGPPPDRQRRPPDTQHPPPDRRAQPHYGEYDRPDMNDDFTEGSSTRPPLRRGPPRGRGGPPRGRGGPPPGRRGPSIYEEDDTPYMNDDFTEGSRTRPPPRNPNSTRAGPAAAMTPRDNFNGQQRKPSGFGGGNCGVNDCQWHNWYDKLNDSLMSNQELLNTKKQQLEHAKAEIQTLKDKIALLGEEREYKLKKEGMKPEEVQRAGRLAKVDRKKLAAEVLETVGGVAVGVARTHLESQKPTAHKDSPGETAARRKGQREGANGSASRPDEPRRQTATTQQVRDRTSLPQGGGSE